MKKKTKISLVCIVLLTVLAIATFVGYKLWDSKIRYKDYSTLQGVIVKVNDKDFIIVRNNTTYDLHTIEFTQEGNIGFEKGQEVIIYYEGDIRDAKRIPIDIKKIKIINKKSDIEISKDVLRHYYSSMDNVNITVSELTDSGITLNIKDTNELPYEISHEYAVYKRVKEPVKFTKDDIETNFTPIEITKEVEAWRMMERKSNISSQETGIKVNTDQDSSLQVIKFDWTPMYGKLQPRKISI